MNLGWKVELIDAHGSSISCAGSTPDEALVVAERISKWFRPAFVSDPYLRQPSTRFPGVPDGSLPPSERVKVPAEILTKYSKEVDQ